MDFVVLVDHKGKMKESEKIDKYLYLARELKKLRKMRMTVIPVVVRALGTGTQRPRKETMETGDLRKSRDH